LEKFIIPKFQKTKEIKVEKLLSLFLYFPLTNQKPNDRLFQKTKTPTI